MMQVARIDDQVISAEDFVKTLTFHGLMEDMIENLMSERLTVIEAKKQGIQVGDDELQERADQLRRVQGLHRQKDTLDWLESMGITVDEFEQFLRDGLYKEKMLATLTSDEAVEEYFKLNSPKFEAVELSHIMVDSEAKARELVVYLNEEPDDFVAMAKEHSLADTAPQGGKLGRILRETLSQLVEAKVFNTPVGETLGPFPIGDTGSFEIFRVDARFPAELDAGTRAKIKEQLYREWLASRAKEHRIEVL